MKFVALLRKEFRECVPWLLLAAGVLLTIGILSLYAENRSRRGQWESAWGLVPGTTVDYYRLTEYSYMEIPAACLLLTAAGLGLILGIRHFWMPLYTGTWSFLLHRSASRTTIVLAKLAAAAVGFVVSLGLIWTLLYLYARHPRFLVLPPPTFILWAGWLYLVLGWLVYLGTALSALSSARWYTTRIFGLVFATVALFVIWLQGHPAWSAVWTVLALILLVSQTVYTFSRREF